MKKVEAGRPIQKPLQLSSQVIMFIGNKVMPMELKMITGSKISLRFKQTAHCGGFDIGNKEDEGFQDGTYISVLSNQLNNGASYCNWKDRGRMDISVCEK